MSTGNAVAEDLIDCHVHLWELARPEGIYWIKKDDKVLYRDYLADSFEEVAKKNGVTGVVLVQAGQHMPDNQWNLDVSAHNKKLFRGVVGNLSPVIGTDDFAPAFEKLCKDPRYLGYRLSGRYKDELSDEFFRDLKLTAKAGKTVDFLTGNYPLEDIDMIAKRVPDLRIIIDHYGGVMLSDEPLDPEWIKHYRAVAKNPNVYCKASAIFGRTKEQPSSMDLEFYKPLLDLTYEIFGEDRLVYGSDWPVSRRTAGYQTMLKFVREYYEAKGADVAEKIFSANAEKFYAIPPAEE